MTKKKPDRWERMVEDAALVNGEDRFLDAATIVKLLRKEHEAVVRMVKNSVQPYRDSDDESPACYLAVDILDQLKRRAT